MARVLPLFLGAGTEAGNETRLLAYLNYTRRTPVHARSPVILCRLTRFVARAPCGKSTAVQIKPVHVIRACQTCILGRATNDLATLGTLPGFLYEC